MDNSFDFDSPQDELDYLLSEVIVEDNEQVEADELPDYTCVEVKRVVCEVEHGGAVHKLSLHVNCWLQSALRDIAVFKKCSTVTRHLVIGNIPFIACAHCGDSVVRYYDYHQCDECLMLLQ